jgi:PHD/YefM family antitoxin component YafN of YafNO toxin-antitoxin module
MNMETDNPGKNEERRATNRTSSAQDEKRRTTVKIEEKNYI